MKRWLIALTAIALLGSAPAAMADRDHHDRGRDWHKQEDHSDGRMRMRVRDPHEYRDRQGHRDHDWHRGHHRKHQWHRDNHRRDDRYRNGYRDHSRHNRDDHRGGVVIGIGDDHQGLVIWNR